jgi:hypothetical protein
MRKLFIGMTAVVAAVAGAVAVWRRNPRLGTKFVNETVNPFLVERGLAGTGRAEIGTLEHIGRRSGIRRLTPIHPVATESGFRIPVPLGDASEWAMNVLAAGHCRMQLHDIVYELDEPALLAPDEMGDSWGPSAWLMPRLGYRYLVLHRFSEAPGSLVDVEQPPANELIAEPAAEAAEMAPLT